MIVQTAPFWSFNIGHVLVLCGIVIAWLQYRVNLNKQLEQQNKERDEQLIRHNENQRRLDTLLEFQRTQIEVNRKRDEQIGELKTQTATLTQIARGIDRRLEMLEDK